MDLSIAKEKCIHFSSCSAPFCPLDREHSSTAIWFPDEEVCIIRKAPFWVERQKKLAERTRNRETCYTFNMIKWKCMIKKNIDGILPTNTLPQQKKAEREWMRKRKLKKPLSVVDRKERCRRLENAREIRLEMLSNDVK